MAEGTKSESLNKYPKVLELWYGETTNVASSSLTLPTRPPNMANLLSTKLTELCTSNENTDSLPPHHNALAPGIHTLNIC